MVASSCSNKIEREEFAERLSRIIGDKSDLICKLGY